MRKKKGKSGGSTHSKSNTTEEATYYNLQPPSRASHSNHSNDGQGHGHGHQGQGHHAAPKPVVQSGNTTVDSSSSSSTTSSDSDSVGGHLALVPRPPPFNHYMMGVPSGGYPAHYGMPPGYAPPGAGPGMGGGPGGQLMLSPPLGGLMMPGMGGGMMPGAGPAMGMGPPVRYLPPDDHLADDRPYHYHATKGPHPLVMEHPSLRQFVIFMAILFLLALVALIVTSIYFGRTTETPWNI